MLLDHKNQPIYFLSQITDYQLPITNAIP